MATNRVTTVYLEALRNGPGHGRVTTVYVEVLRSTADQTLTTAEPPVGTWEWVGETPQAVIEYSFTPPVGTVEWVGETPEAQRLQNITPDAAVVEWVGETPTTDYFTAARPAAGEVEWEGFAPTLVEAAFVSQVALLVLGDIPVETRDSQHVAMVVAEIEPSVRASQQALLILGEIIPDVQVTQQAMLILAESQPCITRRAQLWTITRRDGVVFRFTTHDMDMEVEEADGTATYKACNSVMPSASESASTLGSVGNVDLEGVISSEDITDADLYGGLFDDAYVVVDLVSWGDATDHRVRIAAGWCGDLSQGDTGFRMEVLGPGIRLGQQPIVTEITPGCRWVFGSPQCGVDIEALAISGHVTAATSRDFFIADLENDTQGSQWENGRVVWETGPNTGLVNEVKEVDFATGVVTLWAMTSFVAEYQDQFRILPGCDKAKLGGCLLYDNIINFGGFEEVPGTDEILDTPDAKY